MKSFALEVKELPGQNPVDPQAPAPSPTPTNEDVPRWSGDVYQEGDETRPEDSQWQFTGQGGEQAWLDRSDDGTITGWVRDPDGTVYRYTDADAWAVEVDDAGMTREGGAPAEPGAGGEMGGEDPNAAEDPTQGDSFTDPEGEDDERAMEDAAFEAYSDTSDPDGEEADPNEAEPDADPDDEEADPNETEPDADEDDGEEADPNETEPDADEDDEADTGNPFAKKKKRGVEGKVLRLPYR